MSSPRVVVITGASSGIGHAVAIRPPPPTSLREIIADAILYAATRRRRGVRVGDATVVFALGNKFMSDFMGWFAGKVGPALQQSFAGPNSPVAVRDANLMRASRMGWANGAFGGESRPVTPQMWANKNQSALGLGLVTLPLLTRLHRL